MLHTSLEPREFMPLVCVCYVPVYVCIYTMVPMWMSENNSEYLVLLFHLALRKSPVSAQLHL